MTRLTEDQLASVRSSLWFSTLPLPLQDFLATHGRVMQLAAGQRLFARDASADGLYNVIDGGIRISALATDGREAILAILGAPQWFGEIALFDDLQRTHDAMAERPTTLLHIPARWRSRRAMASAVRKSARPCRSRRSSSAAWSPSRASPPTRSCASSRTTAPSAWCAAASSSPTCRSCAHCRCDVSVSGQSGDMPRGTGK
ncbi:MAG: transcriptional regulator, Crp/Fnr family [Ramlibacter sp.]|nr:transcriptional regulator, Crp/Fnr family [Ramlibacter sp.]